MKSIAVLLLLAAATMMTPLRVRAAPFGTVTEVKGSEATVVFTRKAVVQRAGAEISEVRLPGADQDAILRVGLGVRIMRRESLLDESTGQRTVSRSRIGEGHIARLGANSVSVSVTSKGPALVAAGDEIDLSAAVAPARGRGPAPALPAQGVLDAAAVAPVTEKPPAAEKPPVAAALSDALFCSSCGTRLRSEDVFCPRCGHKAGPAAPSTETSAPAAIAPLSAESAEMGIGQVSVACNVFEARIMLRSVLGDNQVAATQNKSIELAEGLYILEAEAPGYARHEEAFWITRGVRSDVAVRMVRFRDSQW